ncbi:MAG: class I SAM-dependent RNA methyltransferase [Oligoflexia bacterium]|nr:class I SAM-dependent RNA methyltransferase [Oligoflexia bacterium]MBF0365467.1 class I SAM-dependent RNA methyltransferase [Oligoflexia bacterium]
MTAIGEQFEGVVRNLSSKGYGVVEHPSGRVFFARGAWPLDHGIFEIEFCKQKYGQARLVKLLTASPERISTPSPPCPYQGHDRGKCGGCPWMIATYEHQLKYKQHRIIHALDRQQVKYRAGAIKAIIGSAKTLGHRNRMQFKTDGTSIGLVSENSNQLVPIDHCLAINEKMQAHFQKLKQSLPREDWKPSPAYPWNYIDIDDDMDAEEISTSLKLNRRRAFKQGNSEQNLVMRAWLRSKLSVKSERTILELFCGQGNFTEEMVTLSPKSIVAVEVDEDAKSLLLKRRLLDVEVISADLFASGAMRWLKQKIGEEKASAIDTLVTNPPRDGVKGMHSVIQYFPNIKEVFYISCDPETFVRDAKILQEFDFELNELQPIDQFPQTPHVEILALFYKA